MIALGSPEADLARALARAFQDYADALEPPAGPSAAVDEQRSTEAVLADLLGRVPGPRQRAALAVEGLRDDEGVTMAQIHRALDRPVADEPNTHSTLHRLKDLGLIELVPGQRPMRCRLVAEWREAFRQAGEG